MNISVPFDFPESTLVLMRRAGYHTFTDPNTGKNSFIRRFSHDFYPRFHVYEEINAENRRVLSLHLDQKKPSYAGAHAHSGEYAGEVVEREAARIAGLLKNQIDNAAQTGADDKKGFFSRLFGN